MTSIEKRRQEILNRLNKRRGEFRLARTKERKAVGLALAILFVGGSAVLLSLENAFGLSWTWIVPSFLVSMILTVFWRGKCTRSRKRLGYAVEWMERALQRLEDQFQFGQEDGAEYLDPKHPYALDLDLFGKASLFEKLNACHTALGREALARMITGDLPQKGITARQEAIQELFENVDFREKFEVGFCVLKESIDPDPDERRRLEGDTRSLLAWGDEPELEPNSKFAVLIWLLLGGLATGVLVAKFVFGLSWFIFLPFYLLNMFVLSHAKDIKKLLESFFKVRNTLDSWSRLLGYFEKSNPRSPVLQDLRNHLFQGPLPASRAIFRLKNLADRLVWRRSKVWLCTFDILWLWDLHVRRALLQWKQTHGSHLKDWFLGISQLEALLSLATYAEAVPDATIPVISDNGLVLSAEGLAYPLLPRDVRVGNDIEIKNAKSVLLVTGSNMSGKSTFLRTVGLAVVMTRMGLPVSAKKFRMREMDVTTCMRVQDSISQGSSKFHAEVTRLKFCVDRAGQNPLILVLLDEILAGTNSRERHIGTMIVLRDLVENPSVTLIATHDLQLASLADEFPGRIRLVHFRDFVQKGSMSFDYKMRPGPLPTTNALRVMQSVGFHI